MKSKFLTLDWKDFSRGLLIAFLTAVISGIIEMLDIGTIFTWVTIKPVLIAGVSGALAYLLKCLMTNSQDQMFKREPTLA
jgi:membrane associated rhomboid family serine protease